MPLTPQHSWDETDTTMNIVVTAPGLTKAKSDLLICDTFVRINAPPYLLQLDLAHAVDDCNGTAVFGTSSLALRLTKVERGLWGQLAIQAPKEELHQRRQQAQQRLADSLATNKQAQLDRKKALDKAASDRRIDLDRQKRDAIEQQKQQELDAQRAQVASWQTEVDDKGSAESDYEEEQVEAMPASLDQDHSDYHGRGWRPKKARAVEHAGVSPAMNDDAQQPLTEPHDVQQDDSKQAIWKDQPAGEYTQLATGSQQSSSTLCDLESSQAHGDEAHSSDADMAPVRSGCVPVAVQFTKLETEHLPARETREQEISSYKRKSQDHEALEESLDLAERQPLFLKDKADGMHRAGNYRAAVNAYTKAIQLDMGMTVCYSNRAASYLKLKELCIQDCTTALAQMEATMSSFNAGSSTAATAMHSSMIKLLTRRAAAQVELHDFASVKADLGEALARRPDDKQLQDDLQEVNACLQPASSSTLRRIADDRFKSQDMQGAADAYTALLALPDAACTDKLAAASNRAACSLAQRDYAKVVADCNLAFGLLTRKDGLASLDIQKYLQSNQTGSVNLDDKQKQSLCRLLARRGVALGHLARYNSAVLDLQAAQDMYSAMGQQAKASSLQADIQKIQGMQYSS
ncbi:MAG: dyslexia susceptibility 1 candidate protein [Trebouxia sp. A1-2]|nr:MAG: dyslexia susceptibility 1 candidate protein [Trebouxia sp. A1-2]